MVIACPNCALSFSHRASGRCHEMKAERWDEKHWNDTDHARTGRGKDTVLLMLNHAQNHLWREVWPAAPRDGARGKYWRDVRVQVHAIHHGGGGGMQAAADAAAAHVETVALAEGRTGTRVERQMAETRRGVLGSLRAATATPCTKEHLSQTGEYSLQDVSLSDPFEVNVALVMNAYCCFARCTGCRPGMAVNSRFDDLDPDARWFELPPLWNGSVSISPDEMCLEVEGLGKFLSMEVKFNRKKGEYYACYDFGTGITPDSDEMVRMGTLAMVRLLLATGAFRACYQKLDAEDSAAAKVLRDEVAHPDGFAGLDWRRTGFGSVLELVEACRRDGWVLDAAAVDRPLFPSVNKAGKFIFYETFTCRELCKKLILAGKKLGMNSHSVGAWSLRKDACEAVAKAGDGQIAARVLGHRSVNSRTLDRVYRADLRLYDLGAYSMGRKPEVQQTRASLTCLSARRVVEAGGVRSFADVPDGPEREAVGVSSKVSAAEAALEDALRALHARLNVDGAAVEVGARGWKDAAHRKGAAAEVSAVEMARRKKAQSVFDAHQNAIEAFRLRVYKEGQLAHSKDKSLMVEMCLTHAWGDRSENDAIAFGLERMDRTSELKALRKLPPELQGSILSVGALHVLPHGCSLRASAPSGVYEYVAKQCNGLCSLICSSEECGGAHEVPLPSTLRAFEAALSCAQCGDKVELWWWIKPSANALLRPLALGATEALGPSYSESYAVWLRLCGRSAIGNAAFVAGESMTRTRAAPSVTAAVVTLPVAVPVARAAAAADTADTAAAAAVAARTASDMAMAAADVANAAATTQRAAGAVAATMVASVAASAATMATEAAQVLVESAAGCIYVNAMPFNDAMPFDGLSQATRVRAARAALQYIHTCKERLC